MRIALIGPGIMPIPPPGWGAVEILIWDYYQELVRQHQEVDIINVLRRTDYEQKNPYSPYCQYLIQMINQGNYDFVHIHYDCLYGIIPFLTVPSIGITSHYPYIDQMDKYEKDGYSSIFNNLCKNQLFTIFAVSQKDYDQFKNYCECPDQVVLMLNGANPNEIIPIRNGKYRDHSIYVGKIEPRKQQHKYASFEKVDFYGKCDQNDSFFHHQNYKGELAHSDLMKVMPEYGNLILLSTGENGTPLVVKEALMAGLPVIINSHSTNDIDITLPFIDVIPDAKLDDLNYIQTVIEKNRDYIDRDKIREYALKHFAWPYLVEVYLKNILKICSNKSIV